MVQATEILKPASLDTRILDHVAELLRLGCVIFIPVVDLPPPGLLESIEEHALRGARVTFLSAGVPRGPTSLRGAHRLMVEVRSELDEFREGAGNA